MGEPPRDDPARDEPARPAPAIPPAAGTPRAPADESITQRLVRGAQAGDESALAPLYERLRPALLGWAALRIPRELSSRLEAEDLLQDIWLRALSAFASFDPARGSFRPWLFQVAKYTLLDALRRLKVRPAGPQEPEESGAAGRLSQVADEATAVSRALQRRDEVSAFLERVAALDEDDQALLVHHGLEGLSLGDAAERLGLGKAAAQKRWQRLRDRLQREGLPQGFLD